MNILEEIDALAELNAFDGNTDTATLLTRCREEISHLAKGDMVRGASIIIGALTYESPDESFLESRNRIDALKQQAADLKKLWDAIALERCEARGDMVLGRRRWYSGIETKKKCRDPRLTLQVMLDTAGGDLGAVADCLAAQAWKPGESEKLLGARFTEVFEVTRGPVLKDGELLKSQKQLIESSDFARQEHGHVNN